MNRPLPAAHEPTGRALILIAVPVVGLTGIYASAHLPLNIAGGAALGLAVDAAVAFVGRPERPTLATAQAGDFWHCRS